MVILQLANSQRLPVYDNDVQLVQQALDVMMADRKLKPRFRTNPTNNAIALSLFHPPLPPHYTFGDVERCVAIARACSAAGMSDVTRCIVENYGHCASRGEDDGR